MVAKIQIERASILGYYVLEHCIQRMLEYRIRVGHIFFNSKSVNMKSFTRSLIQAFFIVTFVILSFDGNAQNVAINTDGSAPDASAMLDVKSTTKGLLIPRADTSAVSTPATGLMVFQNSDKTFYFYNGANWQKMSDEVTDHIVSIDSLTDGKTYQASVYLGEGAGNADDGVPVPPAIAKWNTGVGVKALYNSTGSNNTAVGSYAAFENTTGTRNTALGRDAMYHDTSGADNIAIGYRSQFLNESGNGNVVVGNDAMHYNTIGSQNTIIGQEAGKGEATGPFDRSGNVFIGFQAGMLESGSDKLYIENSDTTKPLIWGDFANDSLKVYGTFGIKDAYFLPLVDGSSGQVLYTDGNGNLSWTNNDADSTNELQTISRMGTEITLSDGGGTVSIADNDNDTSNEIQDLSLTNDTLTITNNATATDIDLKPYLDNTDGQTLSETQTGTVYDVSISNGNTIMLDVADNDNDTANEIQDLNLANDTLTITNNATATDIDLKPYLDNTDGQTLSIAMDSLEISNGNKVNLADYKNNISKVGKDSMTITFGDTISLNSTTVCDVDMDTKIEAEKTADEDKLRFTIGGNENFTMDSTGHLEVYNTGNSIFIGEGAGAGDDLTSNWNIAIGKNALNSNVSGYSNTAVGFHTLKSNTGNNNTAIGYNALEDNTTYSHNTAIGNYSLYRNSSGENTAVGSSAMIYNSGGKNTAIGRKSLSGISQASPNTGQNNTAIGYGSMERNDSGSNNTVVGYGALQSSSTQNTGSSNTAIGFSTMNINQSGSSNAVVGDNTLRNNTSGSDNSGLGSGALYANTTGNGNVSLGRNAARENTTGANNVTVGMESNYYNQGGSNNTLLGYQAGKGASTHDKSGNIFIGYQAGLNDTTDNKLYIENSSSTSPLIWGDFANDTVKIYGTFGIKDSYHFPISDGTNGQTLITDGNGNTNWSQYNISKVGKDSLTISYGDTISLNSTTVCDTDMDTKIEVEKTSDEDILHFTIGGYERVTMDSIGHIEVLGTARSVYLGEKAGLYHTTAASQGDNTGIGYEALKNNKAISSGDSQGNTAVGSGALATNNRGRDNTAMGRAAMNRNTTGENNVAVGSYALEGNVTKDVGSYNVAIGYRALSEGPGSRNVAIGYDAFKAPGGSDNIAIGYHSGSGAGGCSGNKNIMIGYEAGGGNYSNYSSQEMHNISIGYKTLTSNHNGIYNTIIGAQGHHNNRDGSNNSALGIRAAYSNYNGNNNVSLGDSTNFYNQNGNNNTIIGHKAGAGTSAHSKSGNVFIGYKAGHDETGDNKLYIENSDSASPLIYGEFDNDKVKINGSLEVSTTTGAFIVPRMTSAEAGTLTAVNGMMIYVTDTDATFTSKGFWGYEEGAWVKL